MTPSERMLRLYTGNMRSMGRFDPATGKMFTEYAGPITKDFDIHIRGKQGIGVVPIMDDNNCWWAAIDIDNHDQDEDIPIAPIDQVITSLKLPLVPCRSKSGGVHAYLFLSEAVPAAKVRTMMAQFAEKLGYPTAEIFPKQSKLPINEGKRQMGNWINLPYMAGDETERYAVRGGHKLKLEQFLDLAEKGRVTGAELADFAAVDHPHAPPCVQKMMQKGVASGFRNEAMYQTVIYLKKMDPEGFKTRAELLNTLMYDKPLGKQELMKVVNSAGRSEYGFRCNEQPAKGLCNREECLKRQFGITSKELDKVDELSGMPKFDDLTQLMTDPPRWEFNIDGKRVGNVSTEDLLDFHTVRVAIADKLLRVIPMLKPSEWDNILRTMMENVRKVEVPDDASPSGQVRERLWEFLMKADLSSDGHNTEERKAILRGIPVVQMHDGERKIFFRGHDFIQYLKRTKSEELRGVSMWYAVKLAGGEHTKFRIGGITSHVWCLPVTKIETPDPDQPEFKSDL